MVRMKRRCTNIRQLFCPLSPPICLWWSIETSWACKQQPRPYSIQLQQAFWCLTRWFQLPTRIQWTTGSGEHYFEFVDWQRTLDFGVLFKLFILLILSGFLSFSSNCTHGLIPLPPKKLFTPHRKKEAKRHTRLKPILSLFELLKGCWFDHFTLSVFYRAHNCVFLIYRDKTEDASSLS